MLEPIDGSIIGELILGESAFWPINTAGGGKLRYMPSKERLVLELDGATHTVIDLDDYEKKKSPISDHFVLPLTEIADDVNEAIEDAQNEL